MANPIPEYVWDDKSLRYRSVATGRYVSERTINRLLNDILDASADDMIALSKQLQAGAISLDAWFLGMQVEIKNVHLIGEAMAKGGWNFLTLSDFGKVGNIVKGEYKYLRTFAEQISNGTQKLDGRFLQRVKQYVFKARTTYTQQQRTEKEKRGLNEERRVLGKAEHCSDCLRYADMGWQPIGTLPPIGDSQCRYFCHCTFEHRFNPEATS